MQPTRAILMLGLCLAILGPVWPKALVKMMNHPTEGVVAQDDASDADDSVQGILPVATLLGIEPVRYTIEPLDRLPLTLETFRIPSSPRAPPGAPCA